MIQKNELSTSDVERMKAEFFQRGGSITRCPPKNLGSKQLRSLRGRTETVH